MNFLAAAAAVARNQDAHRKSKRLTEPLLQAGPCRVILRFHYKGNAVGRIVLREHCLHQGIQSRVDALARNEQFHARIEPLLWFLSAVAATKARMLVGLKEHRSSDNKRRCGKTHSAKK